VQGKATCKRIIMQGAHAGKPIHSRVRVLVEIVMDIGLENSINNNLGGLGRGSI
jgi:hypothetical protein